MESSTHVVAVISRESDGYIASCPGMDISTQGTTAEEAKQNLEKALSAFMTTATPAQIAEFTGSEVHVTGVRVSWGG